MAEALRKRNKPDHALRTYLEVAYLNLNGPRNFVYYSDKNKGRDTRFVPKEGLLLVEFDRAAVIIKKMHLSLEDVRGQFIEIANNQYRNLKLPLPPEEAWGIFHRKLKRFIPPD
mgnify:CR=1 FL=1